MSAPADLAGRVEAMEGRDGRLFFACTPAAEARELYGRPWTDDDRLRRLWAAPLARLAALADGIGARLLVLVPPDAHAVHAEALPEGFALARPTVGERFSALFGDAVEVLHPLERLREARGATDPYRRTDSHWSAPGAYAAYRDLMGRLAGLGAHVVPPEEVLYAWAEEAGDLGAVSRPARRAETPRPVLAAPRARCVLDRMNHRRHALKIMKVDDPALPRAVVLRDSFVTEMAPFLAEGFRRTVLVGSEALGFLDLVREERPDVVIVERAERGLPLGLHDPGLLGWREHWPQPGDGPHEAAAALAEREAARALDAGDGPAAVLHAEEALRRGPTVDRRLLLGRALLASGRAQEAAAVLETALAEAPGRWAVLMQLGVARLAAGRTAEARDLFGRACAAAPDRPRGFEHFGYAALLLGEPAAARGALEHAVATGPDLPGAWTWLLAALERLGDAESAARARARAAALAVDIPAPPE